MGFRTEVPDSEVTFEVVSYEDPTRFEPFDCRREDRPSPSANEINDLIRTGAWRSWGPGVACLEFATDGSVIGYAVLLFEPFYHPETTSDDEALYLNAAIIAVDRR